MRRLVLLPVCFFVVLALKASATEGEGPQQPIEEWQIRGILRALKEDEYQEVRAFAVMELAQILMNGKPFGASRPHLPPSLFEKARQARPALRDLLNDKDRSVRWAAAKALSRLWSKDDVPALRDLLKDKDRSVRGDAAEALGRVGSKDDAPALRDLLKDKVGWVRENAAKALVRVASKYGVPALRRLLKDEDSSVRGDAAEALGRVGSKDDAPALRDLLNDKVGLVRYNAAKALGRVGSKDDAPALRRLLKDEDSSVRSAAAEALGRVGSKDDAPALRDLLKDKMIDVCRAAAKALGRVGSKYDAPALRDLLKNIESFVRREAAEAVGRVKTPQDEEEIRHLKTQYIAACLAAVEALGRVGSKDDAPALRNLLKDDLLKDEDRSVRRAAAKALGRIGIATPTLALTVAYENTSTLAWCRWLARYWGGKSPNDSEVLCAYLGRAKEDPGHPISVIAGGSQRQRFRNDIRILREQAWYKTDSRWVKEDVAKWWSQIITQEVKDWTTEDVKELKSILDCLKDKKNTTGRGYIPGIEQVLAPFDISPSPLVRTLLAFLATNLFAFLLYRLSPTVGGLKRWLPFAVPLATGIGVSLADVADWADRLHTIPWLFGLLLLVEFAMLVGGGVFSPALLRTIAPVKPFNLVIPLALRLPWGRRRHFRDYIERLRNLLKYDQGQALGEEYVALPADLRDNKNPTPRPHDDPANAIFAFLLGANGSPGHVLVEATGGRGKSALIRKVVSVALEEFEKYPGRRPLPVVLTGKGDSIENMVKEALGATLILEEILPQHLSAGDFILVLDGVSESGLSDKVLAGFFNGPYSATRLLLGSRPTPEFHGLVESTPPWMTVEPRRLDETSLDQFVAHYKGPVLLAPVKAACRSVEGTYLPILVRLAMRVNTQGGIITSVADIYREYFLQMFAAQFPDHQERLRFLHEAGRWCLETYWKDGRRNRTYEGTVLQKALLKAGLLIPVGGIIVAKEVKFFHDSMQSYLTAEGLTIEDGKCYKDLPRPEEDGDGEWDRRRVLFRIAGYPRFAEASSDIVLTGGSELFQMFLTTFADKEALRRDLHDGLRCWADRHHQELPRRQFKKALPRPVPRKVQDNCELLHKAIQTGLEADEKAQTAESLGAIYGCLAPLVWALPGDEGDEESADSAGSPP
jgi:HEAT repeat protein